MTLDEVAATDEIIAMAHREADAGAPGGMVAVYVELALRHLRKGHPGHWSACSPCHALLDRAAAPTSRALPAPSLSSPWYCYAPNCGWTGTDPYEHWALTHCGTELRLEPAP